MLHKYTYRQNNSFGVFEGPERVTVMAENYTQANALAEAQGVYFDGIEKGIDCPCCGDRWYRVYWPDRE